MKNDAEARFNLLLSLQVVLCFVSVVLGLMPVDRVPIWVCVLPALALPLLTLVAMVSVALFATAVGFVRRRKRERGDL